MGQPNTEPSMEDILASIKRIIAEDSDAAPPTRTQRVRRGPVAVPDPEPVTAAEPDDDDVDADERPSPAVDRRPAGDEPRDTRSDAEDVPAEAATDAPEHSARAPEPRPAPIHEEASDVLELTSPLPEDGGERRGPILSGAAEQASRSAFAALGQLQVRAEGGQPHTLDGLVADLLKPMLAEWLDRELPALVERVVTAEVKRLSQGS